MAITKQSFPINFALGLDTKTDPKQVQIGKFISLENTIFEHGGLLQKRNGFGALASLPDNSSTYLTTFNGNLTTVGNSINAYNANSETWISKGSYQSLELSTLPLIRNSLNQSQADSVVSDGVVCTVYTSVNNATNTYLYAVADAITGQNIIQPSQIPFLSGGSISGSSRVFVVANLFVILSPVTISGITYLQYCYLPIKSLLGSSGMSNISSAYNVSSDVYVQLTTNPGWDAVVINNTIVVAYNSTTGGQGVHIATLAQQQIASNNSTTVIYTFTGSAYVANLMSICVDIMTSGGTTPIIYGTFYNDSTQTAYTFSVSIAFGSITLVYNPIDISGSTALVNIATAAQNGMCTVFTEVQNSYGYDSAIQSNFINRVIINNTGIVIGSVVIAVRGVGIASKAFIVNGEVFLLTAYQSPFQPTYFLINGSSVQTSPKVVAKIAYENGGGYLTLGLPSVTVTGNVAQIPYLYKDLIAALNTQNNTQQTTSGGIYAQTGINLASFTIGTTAIASSEIGNNLNIGGGFGWMYDGYLPVEQNFFLWPDSVAVVASSTAGSMGAGEYYYQAVYEWSDNQGNIFRSAPSIPVSITLTSAHTSVTVSIPTLRITYKTANILKIVLYRWSTNQPIYYQVTSITAPYLNSTTSDYVTIPDGNADSSILGNSIIYTTGGVVEDLNPPSYNITTLFDTRQWIVNSEDPNLLWYSKQIIEGTPVEFSDLFTYYIAPNAGTTAATGPITAIFPMDDKLIVFKKDAIYYINGSGPDNTGTNSSYSQPLFITATVGCQNQNSIVFMPQGLMFQSEDGIWLLGRDLSTNYIGAPVEKFNGSTVESALNVPGTTQVRFTLNTGEHLLYDYYYSNWGTFTGVPAISSCVYLGLHTILSAQGRVYQETPGVYLDGSNPVLMSFITGHIQLQGISGFERILELQILGQYVSPHLLNFQIGYDYGAFSEQVLITPSNYTGVYGSDDIYGQTSPDGGLGSLEQWRIQPGTQKCQAFQISLQEVYDPSFGVQAGAGFTLSAITCVLGLIRGYRPVRSANTAGTSN